MTTPDIQTLTNEDLLTDLAEAGDESPYRVMDVHGELLRRLDLFTRIAAAADEVCDILETAEKHDILALNREGQRSVANDLRILLDERGHR